MRTSSRLTISFVALFAVLSVGATAASAEDQAKISVAAPSGSGTLALDGKEIGPLPVVGYEVAPGRHEIVVTREGHSTFRRWVMARAGTTVEVVAVLVPTEEIKPPAPASTVTATDEVGDSDPVTKKWWFWTIIGAAVVAGTVTTIALVSSGDDFVPAGELGRTPISEWEQR